jgi:hypothetical protein
MKLVTLATIASGISKADITTLAVNSASSIDRANLLCGITKKATTADIDAGSAVVTEDSSPLTEFTPQYLSVPVMGCNAASICTAANAADIIGEFATYTKVFVDTNCLIYGTLNFSQNDDGYTPQITSSKSIVYSLWA